MRSAACALSTCFSCTSTTRRTFLAGFTGAGVGLALRAPDLPAQPAPAGSNGLLPFWYERCLYNRTWLGYGEGRDSAHEESLRAAWAELDERIIHTRALTLEDLQAEFALLRAWLEVPDGMQVAYPADPEEEGDDDVGLTSDGFLMLGIVSDIERMFQGEMEAVA